MSKILSGILSKKKQCDECGQLVWSTDCVKSEIPNPSSGEYIYWHVGCFLNKDGMTMGLQTETQALRAKVAELEREVAELRADRERLVEALTVYADPENFVDGNDWHWKGNDNPGITARAAIAAARGKA